jgi:hypothetical protein
MDSKKAHSPMGEYRDPSKQKRKNARIRVNNITATFKIEGTNQDYECQILDLGTGGLGIATKTLLYPGDKIKIHFWLEGNEFNLLATVSRTSGKNVGLIFEDPPLDAISKIQNYIHSKLFKS